VSVHISLRGPPSVRRTRVARTQPGETRSGGRPESARGSTCRQFPTGLLRAAGPDDSMPPRGSKTQERRRPGSTDPFFGLFRQRHLGRRGDSMCATEGTQAFLSIREVPSKRSETSSAPDRSRVALSIGKCKTGRGADHPPKKNSARRPGACPSHFGPVKLSGRTLVCIVTPDGALHGISRRRLRHRLDR
jgi:hypothetical protein